MDRLLDPWRPLNQTAANALQLLCFSMHSYFVKSEYSKSDRFIHDELIRRCNYPIVDLPNLLRDYGKVEPTILLWPEESLPTLGGGKFSGVIFSSLPHDQAARRRFIQAAAEQCRPFGIFVVEQLGDCVRAIFESRLGTRTWRLQLRDLDNQKTLGAPAIRDNAESIGVLWEAN